MIINFSNNEIGLYDFNKLLYSDRYSKSEIHNMLKKDTIYLHENLRSDFTCFYIDNEKLFSNEEDDIIIIGYLCDEPVYLDSKILNDNN